MRQPKRFSYQRAHIGLRAFRLLSFVAATGSGLAAQAQDTESAPLAPAESAPTPAPAGAEAAPVAPVDTRPLPPPPPQGASPQAQGAQGGYGGYPAGQQGYGAAPYQGGYPPPPPEGVYRPFSFTLGAGPGVLRLNNGEDTSPAYGIAYAVRFGFGVQPDVILTLGFEGSSATKNGTTASQDAFLLGLQYFATQVFYVRGAMGIANETEQDAVEIFVDQNGLALQAAAGVDLIQGSSVALSLEASIMLGRYPGETWTGGGLNLLFSLY